MSPAAARNRGALIAALATGARAKFLFFWGHTPKAPGQIDRSCLSQWWPCHFEVDGQPYPSAEHFMMAEKARLFGDLEERAAILRAGSPGAAKAGGRRVRGFDAATWTAHRFEIVVRGSVAKFGQDPALGAFLEASGDRILVEASPRDRIWGIGLSASHPDAAEPLRWRGENLLGFALMEARARLRQPAPA